MKMHGNTVFITGGTSGIGRGLAVAFQKLGNKVIVAGRRKELLDEIEDAYPGIDGIHLDITDTADIKRAAASLMVTYPSLNVLINNAGIMPFDDASGQMDDDAVQKILTTNFMGPIRMTSALIEHLKSRDYSVIINNTSILGFTPLASNAVYSASKAALHSYTLSQRFQLRNTSVSMQEIAPPWVDTDLVKKSGDPRAMPLDAFIEQTMAGLATDAFEVVVESARKMRENPGASEHEWVNQFNEYLAAEPIPV